MARATKTPAKKTPAKKTPAVRMPVVKTDSKPVIDALVKTEVKPEAKAEVAKVEAPKVEAPKPPKPVYAPCEVSATWADWMDATKRAALIGRKLVLPVLCAAYITVDDFGSVVMRSTDLEVTAQTTMPTAFIDGSGPMLINASMLLDALKGIKGGLTAAKANCERVSVIRGRNGAFTVTGFGRELALREAGVADDDYPAGPRQELTRVAHLPSGSFLDGFEFALRAAGHDDTLPMLTGVLMTNADGPLTYVGTDRYRLAVNEVGGGFETFRALVPRHAYPWLKALKGAVDLFIDKPKPIGGAAQPPTMMKFQSGHVTIWSRLLDATFPPYLSLLPSDGVRWKIDRLQLMGDVVAAAAISDRNAPISIRLEEGKYQVHGCEIHAAEGGDSDGWVASFNPQFLLDGLKCFHGDTITLMGNSNVKPFMLIGERFNHEAKHLIMPTRLPS